MNPTAADLGAIYDLYRKSENDTEREQALALYKNLVEGLPVIKIGPTWQTDAFGNWVLPEHTLGWQIIGWIADYLQLPGEMTAEQARFFLWWYAVDSNGTFCYRNGVLQRLKGWGKDPVAAILALVEFLGPSHFSHWEQDDDGNWFPVAERCETAWVQIAATALDQTRNTANLFPALISDKLRDEFGIKEGEQNWRALGGQVRMEVVTSNPRTIEGGRATFVIINEPHQWVQGNKGLKMYEVIRRNATKIRGRWLAITNAYLPGEDSVGERLRMDYDMQAEGRSTLTKFFYDSLEAHPLAPLTREAAAIILPKVRGDAWWFPVEDTIDEIMVTSIAPSLSRRFYYNQIVAEEDAVLGPAEWDAVQDREAELRKNDEIVMGFDGSLTNDSTALVAIRVKDNTAFLIDCWEKDDPAKGWADDGEINRALVESAVHQAFKDYKVIGFYCDVAYWESYVIQWHEQYGEQLIVKAQQAGSAVDWDMRRIGQKAATIAHETMLQAIFDGTLRHDGNPTLRRHALNARRRTNVYGLSFSKETPESPRKVDAYAALMIAYKCLTDYRTKTKKEPKRSKRVWAF